MRYSLALCVLLAACASTDDSAAGNGSTDEGAVTNGATDDGAVDAGTGSGAVDAGTGSGAVDGGTGSGAVDGGTGSGAVDAGTGSDAGSSDAGSSDAGSSDAGSSDAGSSDAGSSDAGSSPVVTVAPTLSPADAACAVTAAIPDDGRNDRDAIQAALTSKGCAYLRAGVYDIDTPSFTPPARRVYQMLQVANARLFGDGETTVLRFRGSAGGQDWQGIRMTGTNASLHDLAINTAAISNTDEQTHAVRVLGPATAPSIFHVSFDHPQRGEPGGDCVQLVGYAATPITGARITRNQFDHCDRSGVAIHSGTSDLEISDNIFADTGDQDIDGEGTGENYDWLITRNAFALGPTPQGVWAIQLQGLDRARITDNVFAGRGIFAYSASNLEIDHNQITRSSGVLATAVVEIAKASSRVNVHHNTITRELAVGPGQVIRAAPHGSGTPDHVTVSDNVIIQQTTGDIINASGIVGLTVERNQITYTGAPGVAMGVQSNGSAGTYAIRTTDIQVNNNLWTGALRAVVAVSGSYAGCGTVSATGNTASVTGLWCTNIATGGKVLGPVGASTNTWLASSCGTLIQ